MTHLETLAEMIDGNAWGETGSPRIYMKRWRSDTKVFFDWPDGLDSGHRLNVIVNCPSQSKKWCESQRQIIAERYQREGLALALATIDFGAAEALMEEILLDADGDDLEVDEVLVETVLRHINNGREAEALAAINYMMGAALRLAVTKCQMKSIANNQKHLILQAVIQALGLPEDWSFSCHGDLQYTVQDCGNRDQGITTWVTVISSRDCDDLPPDCQQYQWKDGSLVGPVHLAEIDMNLMRD